MSKRQGGKQVKQDLFIRRNPDRHYTNSSRAFYALIYYLSGGHRFDFADRSFETKPGDLVWLPRGASYSNTCLEEETAYYQLDFMLPGGESEIIAPIEPMHLTGEKTEFFRQQLQAFETLMDVQQNASNSAFRRAILYNMLGELLRYREQDRWSQAGAERLEASLQWMKQHFTEDFLVEELAKKSGLELSYFEKLFRRCTGMPPVAYRNQLRMEEAKRLLGDGSLSLEQVALRVGFTDVSYFSKLFRRLEEIPPGQYRRKITGP